MAWRPTPEAELITARIFLGDCWIEREIKTLRPGEVVRFFNPAGQPIHPISQEPDAEGVSVIVDRPRKLTGEDGENSHGYGVAVDVYTNLDAVKAEGFV